MDILNSNYAMNIAVLSILIFIMIIGALTMWPELTKPAVKNCRFLLSGYILLVVCLCLKCLWFAEISSGIDKVELMVLHGCSSAAALLSILHIREWAIEELEIKGRLNVSADILEKCIIPAVILTACASAMITGKGIDDMIRNTMWLSGVSMVPVLVLYGKRMYPRQLRIVLLYLLVPPIIMMQSLWKEIPCLACTSVLLMVIMSYQIFREQEAMRDKIIEEMNTELVMKSCMRPHFLNNCLSSISVLFEMGSDNAVSSLDNFNKYLRDNVDYLGSDELIGFEREMMNVEHYVELERMRLGRRLNVIYDIQESNFSVPALSIQPLVENAIKHGIVPKEESGTVLIMTRMEDDHIMIGISDDGVGMTYCGCDVNISTDIPLRQGEKRNVGIHFCRERLERLCQAKFDLCSGENGTSIMIRIPRTIK